MTLLAIALAGVCASLLFPPSARAAVPGPMRRDTAAAQVGWQLPARPLVLTVLTGVGALVALAERTVLVLALILVAVCLAAARMVAGARRQKIAQRREERVLELCEVLASELRSGQPPVTALGHCVEVWTEFEPVATAARLGADVPVALRRLANMPGASGLREVAGAWSVSQGSGAGLAAALTQVAASARESQATRGLIAGELASAQATARLVAALPLVTLAMGSGIGGDPWGFLLTTPAGLACLAVGLALAFLGLWWIERIAVGVMRR